jgi:hypothetical protein
MTFNGDGRAAMVCEIFDCCRFVKETMKDLPKAAERIEARLCHGDFQACKRYKIYREFIGKEIPFDLDLSDAEEMNKIMRCLQDKASSKK